MGLAAASHFIVNVGITEAGPSAFANIKQNYYYVFVGCTLFFLGVAYLWFPCVIQSLYRAGTESLTVMQRNETQDVGRDRSCIW